MYDRVAAAMDSDRDGIPDMLRRAAPRSQLRWPELASSSPGVRLSVDLSGSGTSHRGLIIAGCVVVAVAASVWFLGWA
jgi:hypothetical protein